MLQLKIDESSVFCCDAVSGTLAGLSSQCISVKFVPKYPIPYCRSVSLIIKDQVRISEKYWVHAYSDAFVPGSFVLVLHWNWIFRGCYTRYNYDYIHACIVIVSVR